MVAPAARSWQDDMKKRLKELTDGPRFKAPEGVSTIRVFPGSLKQNVSPVAEYMMHHNVGPGKRSVVCGKNIYGEGRCWLCDVAIAALLKSPKAEHKTLAENMRPRDVAALQVAYVDRDLRQWVGPKLWEASAGIAKTLFAYFLSQDRRIDDIHDGYNLSLTRTGQGLRTRYPSLTIAAAPSAAPKSILAKLKPLSSIIPVYKESEQNMAYKGERSEAPPSPEELEAEAAAAPAPAGRPAAAPARRAAAPPVDELPEEELPLEEGEELPAEGEELPLEEGGELPPEGDELPAEGDELPAEEGDELPAEEGSEVEELPSLEDEVPEGDDLPELGEEEFEPEPAPAPAARRAAPAQPARRAAAAPTPIRRAAPAAARPAATPPRRAATPAPAARKAPAARPPAKRR